METQKFIKSNRSTGFWKYFRPLLKARGQRTARLLRISKQIAIEIATKREALYANVD